MSTLVPRGAGADARGSAVAPVHTLRVAQRGPTVLPHVALGALAYLFTIAPTLVRTLFITLRVRA